MDDILSTLVKGGGIGIVTGGILSVPVSAYFFDPFSRSKFDDFLTISASFATAGLLVGIVSALGIELIKYGFSKFY